MRSKLTVQDMREIAHFHAVVLAHLKMQRLLDAENAEHHL